MARRKTRFVCGQCGSAQPKWFGQCPECGEWNTLEEEAAPVRGGKAARGSAQAVASDSIPAESLVRTATGTDELDRVLGGGCVPGSVVLVGGEPGIGKSTLLLQAAGRMAAAGSRVLYATGEESVTQVGARARRTGSTSPDLLLLAETSLEAVLDEVRRVKPQVIVLDSVQTMRSTGIEGAPGTVSQVRTVASDMVDHAKLTGAAVFLVGHVTKEGTLAGPKMLEHMVDVVLYFEGESANHYRIVRNVKNRYGSTHEVGVFEMTGRGLVEVSEPSAIFMDRDRPATPGVAIHAGAEGGRGLVVEIQALVTNPGYGTPRRSVTGLDPGRVSLILAVLDRKAGLHVLSEDVFVNAPGGLRVTEPASDLAVAAAIVSAVTGSPGQRDTAWAGELGLTGEVRWVGRTEARIAEVRNLGMQRLVVPEKCLGEAGRTAGEGLEVVGLDDVAGLVEFVRG